MESFAVRRCLQKSDGNPQILLQVSETISAAFFCLSHPAMASYGKRSKHGGSTSGSGRKNPSWGGIQKNKLTPVRARSNAAEWPVYVIGNVTFQWNHKPSSTTDEETTIAALAA